MLRKGKVNTEALLLTLPSNGSSINTKYLFLCYCATSVLNSSVIFLSPSLGVSKYTRKWERLAGSWCRCARLKVVQHRSLFSSLCTRRAFAAALEFALAAPARAELCRIPPAKQAWCITAFSVIWYLHTQKSREVTTLKTSTCKAAN